MLDFQKSIKAIEKNSIKIIGASTDSLENALKTVKRYDITFPVGYGLDPRDVSAKTGAFFNPDRNFINATAFILDRTSRVKNAVYSSNNLGRLVAKSTIKFIESYMKDEKA